MGGAVYINMCLGLAPRLYIYIYIYICIPYDAGQPLRAIYTSRIIPINIPYIFPIGNP